MFDGIKFPFFSMQQLNLDWILDKLKTVLKFMPIDSGNVGDVLQRNADGAAWMPLGGVTMDIDGLPYTSAPDDYDEIPIYNLAYQQNKKTTISDIVALASSAVSSVNGQTGAVVLDKNDIGLGSVDNVQQYSASNPPPYPVTSVNGQTGAVVITSTAPVTSVNGMTGDVIVTSPVDSVNGRTGSVVLTKSDVGLGSVDNVQQYSASNPPPYPVTSVNGQTGDVIVSGGGSSPTLLWLNSSPAANFSAQTISVNLSGYSFIIVECASVYMEMRTEIFHVPDISVAGYTTYDQLIAIYASGTDRKMCFRDLQIAGNGITVGTGYRMDTYAANGTSDDSVCRPTRIWGIE